MGQANEGIAAHMKSPIGVLIIGYVAALLVFSAYNSWTVVGQIDQSERRLGVIPLTPAELAQKQAAEKAAAEADLAALRGITDYSRAAWHPIHFKPEIDKATNQQCLACHQEILTRKVRTASPAGVEAGKSIAWYQTLDTYTGAQETFHARHLTTPFAKEVMNLQCNFCHQGHDLREEAPGSSATGQAGGFALRKVVDPSSNCLLCHGSFPAETMGFEKGQKWHELRGDLENEDSPNGCLSCHAEQFRTNRHQVTYLRASAIEAHAKANSSDSCYGCHGGRAWYRNSYPYARNPWPGMDTEVPDWAGERPTQSDQRYRLKK